MYVVHTGPDVKYWSAVLCITIPTHISDLEIKVTDFEILKAKRDSDELHCPTTTLLILLIIISSYSSSGSSSNSGGVGSSSIHIRKRAC